MFLKRCKISQKLIYFTFILYIYFIYLSTNEFYDCWRTLSYSIIKFQTIDAGWANALTQWCAD